MDKTNFAENCINWLKDYFNSQGNPKAVVGISGGKDSTVVAWLCAKALGKENVVGVLMPNGFQKDIDDSYEVVNTLGIKHKVIDISKAYNCFLDLENVLPSEQAKINLVPRLRMTALYFVAQSLRGRVVGTGNLCERILGYFTLWGDSACDLNPIGNMLVSEVIALGRELGAPEHLLVKAPSDGLSGMTDEEKIGFTYEELEKFLREGKESVSKETADKIEKRREAVLWKWLITTRGVPIFG